MKLVSPPTDWQDVLELSQATVLDVVKFLARKHGWIVTEKDGKIYCGERHLAARAVPPQLKNRVKLTVRYFGQRDSHVPGQSLRSCFSSAVAMLLDFVRPGALTASPNADDEYLKRVMSFGDTTEEASQLQALRSYGLKATKPENLGWKDIDALLERGHPVPIGILHKGHVSNPVGGGHWITVIGQTENGYLVHDPFGELDLVSGKYLHSDGASRSYSRKNLGPRWMVRGTGGWGVVLDG